MQELSVSPAEQELIKKALNDLNIQSMLFDMDIDIETWSLVPKSNYKEEAWITRWKDKQSGADYDPSDNR